MKIRLTLIAGPKKGAVLELESGALLIGRGTRCGLQIDGDPSVSRNHCLIELAAPRAVVRDLGSQNGTFVNEQRVSEVELRTGDNVRVGSTILQVEIAQPRPEGVAPGATVACVRCAKALQSHEAFATSIEGLSGRYVCEACREAISRTPEIFPGYKILRKLGEGGMGAVYLAANVKNGEFVAVKTLRPQMAKESKAIAMFLREAQTGSQIDHPNAIKLLHSGYAHGLFYFLMEYVEGPDIESYLAKAGRPLSLGEALPILWQMLDVLEFAHGKKLVHRDIKPSNIMFARPFPNVVAKLGDFGLMRSFENTGFSFITKTGQPRGTPNFMPPEQIEDAKNVGPAADLYALASTFFYMLTGDTPLEFKPTTNRILTILEGKPRALSSMARGIPPQLDAVIAKCLEKRPQNRFASARELKAALAESVRARA